MHSRSSGSHKVGSAASDRHPRAIPARHRRTGDDRGCQRLPRNIAQPGDLPKLADQRLSQNSPLKRLAVRRFVGSSPIASTEDDAGTFLRPCTRLVSFLPLGSVRGGVTEEFTSTRRRIRRGSGWRHGCHGWCRPGCRRGWRQRGSGRHARCRPVRCHRVATGLGDRSHAVLLRQPQRIVTDTQCVRRPSLQDENGRRPLRAWVADDQ